ncbi:hypothetical protein [Actinomadura formosensis]|uniref:hypothetical protein n=1 Tax=Actinomadura formosensis TaxID=60706 RepID=UPI003D90EED3
MNTSAAVVAFVAGTTVNTWVMAAGARRLLDTRFSPLRTVAADPSTVHSHPDPDRTYV